jgi:hypothetical protein
MRRRLSDRRARPRFEIVGELWGSLESVIGMPLRNVSFGGALVHSEIPLPAGSEHHVTISCDGTLAPTKIRVLRVDRVPAEGGRSVYRIGLEFLSVGPVLRSQIAAWLAGGGVQVEAELG